jgi:hypothetical protein
MLSLVGFGKMQSLDCACDFINLECMGGDGILLHQTFKSPIIVYHVIFHDSRAHVLVALSRIKATFSSRKEKF